MLRVLLVGLGMLALSACQVGYSSRVSGPFFFEQVRVGDKIVLHQPLTIPSQQVRAFVQGGQPVSIQQVYKQAANCQFEIRQLAQGTLEIKPDEFMITKVVRTEDLFSGLQRPLLVASMGGDGAADLYEFKTRLSVSSKKNPDVRYFTCSHMEHLSTGGDHLRYQQFLQAVGKVVSLSS